MKQTKTKKVIVIILLSILIIVNSPAINVEAVTTYKVTLGDKLKLANTSVSLKNSKDRITKISLAVWGWNNGKNGVYKTKDYTSKSTIAKVNLGDIKEFTVDTSTSPFNLVRKYEVRVWVKTKLYPNPTQPYSSFYITVQDPVRANYGVNIKDADKLLCMSMSSIVYSTCLENDKYIGKPVKLIYSSDDLKNLSERGSEGVWSGNNNAGNKNVTWSDFYDAVGLGNWNVLCNSYSSCGIEFDSMFAVAFINSSGEIIIAYKGTSGNEGNINDYITDGKLASGTLDEQFADGLSFYEYVKASYGEANIKYLTGHSLGGAISNYVSLKTGCNTVTFNAPAITFQYYSSIAYQYMTALFENEYIPYTEDNAFMGLDVLSISDYANRHDVVGLSGEYFNSGSKKWGSYENVEKGTTVLDCNYHGTFCSQSLWAHGMESMLTINRNGFELTKQILNAHTTDNEYAKSEGYSDFSSADIILGTQNGNIDVSTDDMFSMVLAGSGDNIIEVTYLNDYENCSFLNGGYGDDTYKIMATYNATNDILLCDDGGYDTLILSDDISYYIPYEYDASTSAFEFYDSDGLLSLTLYTKNDYSVEEFITASGSYITSIYD